MYGSIYLVVKDFDKSLNFYEKIFNKKDYKTYSS